MSRVNPSTLPSAFYKAVAIGGIALFTVGLILAATGPAVHQEPYSEETQLTRQLRGSSAIQVEAERFHYFYLNLSSGESVVGSIAVTSRGQIDFYVMARHHYEAWRHGERPSGIIVQRMVRSYDFSFTSPKDGTYYFLLDNSDSPVPKQVSISEINSTFKQTETKYREVPDYTMRILGFSSLIVGVAFTIVGLVKKPKPPPKELEKQPISLVRGIRLLSPYLFLVVEAVNGFFGSLLVINWLKIEFYQYYSPRTIQLIIFSPAIDWWIWFGSLVFTFTFPYILTKALGGTVSRPLILSHLTLPVSIIFYLTNLQNLATPLLLLGSFFAICVSVVQSGKLLLMSGVKALIVFLTGLFGLLIPIELASLGVWIQTSFDSRYPFDIDPRWRIPWIETQLFNLAFPAVSWLLLTFLLSWIWVPLLKGLYSKFGTKGIKPYGQSPEWLRGRQILPKLGLLFSIICGVYLAYTPYIYNNQGVRGVDTLWYYQTFDQITSIGDLKHVLLQDPRGVYLAILYVVRLVTFQSSLVVVQWTPALLAILLAVSTYYLVRTGTKNESLASLSAVFATFSFHTTVGIFSGIFANWLAISIIMISLALFLKALEKKSVLYLVLAGLSSLLIALIHRWTWGVTVGIFAFYTLLSAIYFLRKRVDAKTETAFALGVVLINLSPALVAMFLPQLTTPVFALTKILADHVHPAHIVELKVLSNIAYTLKNYVGGAYNNLLITILSIIGIAAIRDYTKNFNRVLTSWVFSVGFVLSLYDLLTTVWRFLYVLPFPVLAAIGLSSVNNRVNQFVRQAASVDLSDKICAVTFQTLLIVVTTLILFNYAMRCITMIY